MDKKEIIKIGKDLIYKVGIYSKVTNKAEKDKLLKLFNKYELSLKKDNTKYAKTVLSFITDLKDDLINDRELKIDSTFADDYINNYFVTVCEVKYYNQLIDSASFNNIFSEFKKKKISKTVISKNIISIKSNFNKSLKLLSSRNISENLLIFTLFKINKPIPALNRLKLFLVQSTGFSKEILIINDLISKYGIFTNEVKQYGIKNLKNKTFNYKYLKFSQDKDSSQVSVNLKVSDSSKDNLRTGNPEFEYKNLLLKL